VQLVVSVIWHALRRDVGRHWTGRFRQPFGPPAHPRPKGCRAERDSQPRQHRPDQTGHPGGGQLAGPWRLGDRLVRLHHGALVQGTGLPTPAEYFRAANWLNIGEPLSWPLPSRATLWPFPELAGTFVCREMSWPCSRQPAEGRV